MSTRPVAIAGYESMVLQVRAGLGERRLVAAADGNRAAAVGLATYRRVRGSSSRSA